MRPLRYKIESGGVEIEMLFTPHLFTYKGHSGLTFETAELEPGEDVTLPVVLLYADVMYAAALNAWELDGKGTKDDAPFKRSDFHIFAARNPREFGRLLVIAAECLTGRALKAAEEAQPESVDVSKKKAFTWTTRRSRSSS